MQTLEGQATMAGSVLWEAHSPHTLCYHSSTAAASPAGICTEQVRPEKEEKRYGGGDRVMEEARKTPEQSGVTSKSLVNYK